MSITFPVKIRTEQISSSPKQRVFYPQVSGIYHQYLQNLMNRSIIYQTQQLMKKQAGDSPTTVEEMLGYYEIKNNQRQVLSLSQSNYTYHQQAAHGMTYIKSLTFDLQKGKHCELSSLFKPGSQYVERISNLVQQQINQREIHLLNEFTEIKPNQEFYLADKTLVIYFQLYEITPYVFGFPIFPISVYDIQEIIEETGPLARLAENN